MLDDGRAAGLPDTCRGEHREERRARVRGRALANLLLVLLDQARASGGRLVVGSFGKDALRLSFPGVRTLVRRDGGFAQAVRDFTLAVACPPGWPFDRPAALVPIVLEPADFAHPNSNGRELCLDLQGIPPERLAEVLHDNLRLRRFRLDHPVDRAAAAFVRARRAAFPADARPLRAVDAPESVTPCDAGEPCPGRDVVDARVGSFTTALDAVAGGTFVRLAPPAGATIDRARVCYLELARPHLVSGVPGWREGAGLVVASSYAADVLRAEIVRLAEGVRALGDERVARGYLDLVSA